MMGTECSISGFPWESQRNDPRRVLPRQLSKRPVTSYAALGKNDHLNTQPRHLFREPANLFKVRPLITLDRLELYYRHANVIHTGILLWEDMPFRTMLLHR